MVSRQLGNSLIEVVIALGLVSISITCVLTLTTQVMHSQREIINYAKALQLADLAYGETLVTGSCSNTRKKAQQLKIKISCKRSFFRPKVSLQWKNFKNQSRELKFNTQPTWFQ